MLRLPDEEDARGQLGLGLVARHRRPEALPRGGQGHQPSVAGRTNFAVRKLCPPTKLYLYGAPFAASSEAYSAGLWWMQQLSPFAYYEGPLKSLGCSPISRISTIIQFTHGSRACCTSFFVPLPGDDAEPRLRVGGDGAGRPADRDRRGTGQDHEEPGPAADGVGAVPRQEGARDQEHRPPDPRGTPQGHPR